MAVTDSGSCVTKDSLFIAIPSNHGTTGVGQIDNGQDVEVYPNPAGTQLNVSFNRTGGAKSFDVYDMAGRKVYEQKLTGLERLVTIDVSGFADGKYILQLKGGGHRHNFSFSVSR